MPLIDFLNSILHESSISSILDKYKEQSKKGFVYERLWDLIIKTGYCSIFPNSKFIHLLGNANNGKLKEMKSIQKYLLENEIISGNSGGCSDITLQNTETNKYVFISCKFPKSKEEQKSVDYYDIQKIISVIDHNKEIYKDYEIYLLVENKTKLLDKIEKANKSSKHITKYMKENNILDLSDLEKYFRNFKCDLIKYKFEEYDEIYCSKKEKLQLRFHQELITNKTSKLIEEGEKQFLWGCKCRSGKTYMVGGLIVKQKEIKDKLNVLIITPAPTETTPQFTDDLFNNFIDFKDFTIHNIKNSKLLKTMKVTDNNIFVMSKQLIQKYVGTDVIKSIKNLKLDFIIFDENHFTGTTGLSKKIFNSYSSKNTVKVYLTATYQKPLKEWNIKESCRLYWDDEDEQYCKVKEIDKLKEKHGEEVNNLKDYDLEYYKVCPILQTITNLFDQQRYNIIKDNIMDSKYGFSFDVLFSLNKKSKLFNYPKEVSLVLRYISGSNKEIDFKHGDKSIFSRINKTCTDNGSRLPFTQLWFLPVVNINEISINLKKLMMEDDILNKYNVMIVNSKNDELVSDIKSEIDKQEKIAKEQKKLGLIILAGNMLSLGITLHNCDVVFLMNDTLSFDKVKQQTYRCMTENKNKKFGFVVDLNISRVLNSCVMYNIYKKDLNVEDKLKYGIENHLINIDTDYFVNSESLVNKLMEIWKEDPINNFKTLLRNLDNDYIEFDSDTQKLINQSFTKSIEKSTNVKIDIEEVKEDKQELPNGKEKVINSSTDSEEQKEEVKKEINIELSKDVFPYIIPLTCILTQKSKNKDFVQLLEDIKENKELLDTFDEQSLVWWNKKGLINIIKDIVEKFYDRNSNVYNVVITFKLSLQSLIDKPKELLELINDCLKPKELEKKKFGEVFTPISLINEMLDKLPTEVWKDKNLKWLDPANGMGNFPIVVYLRLMESLKNNIKDEKERKRHILENMLYMSELNKKNCFICKQILDVNNEYKLNIYNGDSLELDIKKEFNVDKFDIIMGNPPYNASGKKASGNTIWQLFVNKSLEILSENKYLMFIHPNGWRKPNTEKGKFYGLFHKMSSNNTILHLEIHNVKDGMKNFSCGTRYDWYILQNKKNNKFKTTVIDENKIKSLIDLSLWNWLPNCELELIKKLMAKKNERKCEILYSRSSYGADKKWISKVETKEFKYPVVHSTPKDGHRFVWSSRNDNGFYEIKKVIFGDGGINNPIIDIEGKYGMTQHAMAIVIDDIKEGEKISNVLCSPIFEKILKACLWSSFAIEWGMFKDFKKNFYELLDEKN